MSKQQSFNQLPINFIPSMGVQPNFMNRNKYLFHYPFNFNTAMSSGPNQGIMSFNSSTFSIITSLLTINLLNILDSLPGMSGVPNTIISAAPIITGL